MQPVRHTRWRIRTGCGLAPRGAGEGAVVPQLSLPPASGLDSHSSILSFSAIRAMAGCAAMDDAVPAKRPLRSCRDFAGTF